MEQIFASLDGDDDGFVSRDDFQSALLHFLSQNKQITSTPTGNDEGQQEQGNNTETAHETPVEIATKGSSALSSSYLPSQPSLPMGPYISLEPVTAGATMSSTASLKSQMQETPESSAGLLQDHDPPLSKVDLSHHSKMSDTLNCHIVQTHPTYKHVLHVQPNLPLIDRVSCYSFRSCLLFF